MKSIVFDMDGVIFDTENVMKGCWQAEADRLGLGDVTELYMRCVGATEVFCEKTMLEYPGYPPYKEFSVNTRKQFDETNEKNGMPLKPGVVELLSWLKEEGWKVGLASSTNKAHVVREMDMADLTKYFDVIVGGDQLKRSKPAPDIYLMACEEMGVDPTTTYAVEDSLNGIKSAHAAGMMPIMVPDLIAPTEEIIPMCTKILPDLNEVLAYLK